LQLGYNPLQVEPMETKILLERITSDPRVLAGQPVLRGTRLSVAYILRLLASGAPPEDILQEYEGLTREDIQACLLFAAETLENVTFVPLTGEAS
jgi:uncharacterized protein (DUF433 family)